MLAMLVVLGVVATGADLLIASGAGGGGARTVSATGRAGIAIVPIRRTARTGSTAPPTTTTTTTDPGALPQTAALPTTTSPNFVANMAALWEGVSTGVVQSALPAFFPEGAYVQLKTVANAQGDYSDRLVTEYEQDVSAAHQLLGSGAAAAQLVGVDVNSSFAHWVPPGECYNDVGYYEVPNSRMVYSIDGQVGSFGIASMISWRGEWYVVHLGAILRSGGGGEVDAPQSGPGSPTYSSTC